MTHAASLVDAGVNDESRLAPERFRELVDEGYPLLMQREQERLELASWAPIDIAAVLAGGLDPVLPSRLLVRSDGVGLLYGDGRIHLDFGPPETLKSFFAQLAVARCLLDGGRALYIVHDGDAADVVRHLLAFNVPPEATTDKLVLLQPDEPLTAPLELGGFDITVIDGVDDAMALHGLNPDKSVEYRGWLQLEVRPLQRVTRGPVILIDHVAKNKEVRDGWPVGTGAKRAAADVALSFEIVHDFGRGRTGTARIVLAKDRPGGLRGHQGAGREIARLKLQSHYPDDEMITWELLAPAMAVDSEGEPTSRWMPTALMERVSRLLEGSSLPLSKNAIETAVAGKRDYVRQAIKCLLEEGYIEELSGSRGARLHRSAKPYREQPETPTTTSPPLRPDLAPGEVDSTSPLRPTPLGGAKSSPPSQEPLLDGDLAPAGRGRHLEAVSQ